MSFNYTLGIPAGPDNPSDDQPNMQTNNDSNFSIWSIDHLGFNLISNGGYHSTIHQPNNTHGGPTVGGQALWNPVVGSGVPAAVSAAKITGVQQTFTLDYTPDFTGSSTDTQLFSMTGGGGIAQLTGSAGTGNDGWCWIGGALLQWGIVALTSGSGGSQHRTGTVTFKDRVIGTIPFPNNCFSIVATLTAANPASTSPASTSLSIVSKSNTQFTWLFNTSGNITDTPNFYWIAVGN